MQYPPLMLWVTNSIRFKNRQSQLPDRHNLYSKYKYTFGRKEKCAFGKLGCTCNVGPTKEAILILEAKSRKMPTIRSDKSSVQRRMYYLRFFFCFAVSHCLCTCIRICISTHIRIHDPLEAGNMYCWFWSVLLFTTRKKNWYYPVINTNSNITIFITLYVLFRLGKFCCWPPEKIIRTSLLIVILQYLFMTVCTI